MIQGQLKTNIEEEPEIVVREVKNLPNSYDDTKRMLIVDADSIMYFATHFPKDALLLETP